MLDIRLLRENSDSVKSRLAARGTGHESAVDAILALDAGRRAAETQLQNLQADRNRLSKEIGGLRARKQDSSALEAEVKTRSAEMQVLTEKSEALAAEQNGLLLTLPNLPQAEVPVGGDASANPVVRTWGEKPRIEKPTDHVAIAENLGLIDPDRAAKISGSGFACYIGAGARLERALLNFLLDLHTREHGYTRLPIKYAAYTPCFRREAGSAGRETRGLIRMHQFDKVELVKICLPENSRAELEALTADAERVLQLLGLHYRTIELCTGDLGFGSAKTYDIEVWAPGQNAYLEVSSCSNFEEFQARRMNLRHKAEDGKNRFCHTLNGSGTALARLYVALLESGLQPDGSVVLPPALHPYFGASKIEK